MKFTQELRGRIAAEYAAYLEKLEIKDGSVLANPDFEHLFSIGEQVRKNPNIKKYMTKFEVFWVLDTGAHKHLKDKISGTGTITDLCGKEKTKEIAEEVIRFFEAIPYEHYFHFRLPSRLPEGLKVVQLTDDIHIIRIDPEELKIPSHTSLGGALSQMVVNDAYLRVRVIGYDDMAQSEAISLLKRFSYMASANHFIRSEKWHRHSSQSSEGGLFGLKKSVAFELCQALYDKTQLEMSLPSEINGYLWGMQIKDNIFDGYTPPNKNTPKSIALSLLDFPETYEEYCTEIIKRNCSLFVRLHNKELTPEPDHIFSAIEWGFDGDANPNETMGFIQTCVGLEALLGDKEKEKGKKNSESIGTTERLAIRCSYLLGKTPSERAKISKKFRDIYGLRSVLVHGMRQKVSEEHSQTVRDAELMLKQLIYKEIQLQK